MKYCVSRHVSFPLGSVSPPPRPPARNLWPDVEGKQAALLLFTTDRPGKARAVAFHLRKP